MRDDIHLTQSCAGPAIWACIAVFNRIGYTAKCLKLLQGQSYPNIRLVVIDDGSSDGTSEMIKATFPTAILIHGDGSLYWAGAMHVGIDHILERAASDDYVLLLNDDLVFEPQLVEKLLEISRRHPRSLIQAVESCVDEPGLIWQGGTRMNWWTARHERLNYHRHISEFPSGHLERSAYLTGRGVLAPVEVFKAAGNIIPSYKQGGDPEFSRRAAKIGYELLVTYDCSVLSYSKGDNLNETEAYSLKDARRYFFGVQSNCRVSNRWRDALFMTSSRAQALVFFAFDMARVTYHFVKRLKVRPRVAL